MKRYVLFIIFSSLCSSKLEAQYKSNFSKNSKTNNNSRNDSSFIPEAYNTVESVNNILLRLTGKDTESNKINVHTAVPSAYFDTLIYKSISTYTLFSTLKATDPNVILDILDQTLSINYNHPNNGKKQDFWGFGIKANYNTDSKEASIYSGGKFVTNVSATGRYTHFLSGRASFSNLKSLHQAQQTLKTNLEKIEADLNKKQAKIDEVKEAFFKNSQLKSDTNNCCKYCIQNFIYDKDVDSLEKQLADYKFKKLQEAMSFEKIGFKSETLKWFNFDASIGSPSYKIYDTNNVIGKRLTNRQIVDFAFTFSFNQLTHYLKNRVFFYSFGLAFNKTANTDDIKPNNFTEQSIVASSITGNVYNENTQKAYQAWQLKSISRFKFSGEAVFICFPNMKSGFDNYVELATPWFLNRSSKAFYTNRLGFVFPVSIVKDKVKTMLQVYWKLSGENDTRFLHEFGFKVGLPININN